jgi:hypothetical protein
MFEENRREIGMVLKKVRIKICAGTYHLNKSVKFINDTLYRVNSAKRNLHAIVFAKGRRRYIRDLEAASRYRHKHYAHFHHRYIPHFCNRNLRNCVYLQYSYRERYSNNSSRNSVRNSSICINIEEQGSVTSLSTKTKVRRVESLLITSFYKAMLFQNEKRNTSLISCKRSRIILLEFLLCNKLFLLSRND